MTTPVVKVRHHEFASFLDNNKDVAKLWEVDTNEEFGETSFGGSYTVDELISKLELHAPDSEFIYVYYAYSDDPTRDWDNTDYDAVPEVGANELQKYVIRGSLGDDVPNTVEGCLGDPG
jgi:hypothetical protein